jgi:outer membrane lipoprotein-sorting protein
MRGTILLATVFVSFIVTSGVAADAPKPETLLQELKAWLEPAKPSRRDLTMKVRSGGDAVQWKAVQARAQTDGANSILTVLVDPPDVRGTASLVREEPGKPTTEWLYLPTLRRVRRMVPVDEFEPFLNTDFTYTDFGFLSLENRKVKLLGEEPFNGVAAYKLQETPDDQRLFSRIVTWLNKTTQQPLKREYYDVADRLWKVETFGDVSVIHDVPTALHVRMEDVQTGYSSEYHVDRVEYATSLPKELFDWQQLPNAAASVTAK